MEKFYLDINDNKAHIPNALVNEINKRDDEKLERLQFAIEIAALKSEIEIFRNRVELAKLIILI